MSESLHDIAVRMSGGRCGKHCDSSCPANALHHGRPCLVHRIAHIDNADEQIEAMIAWGKEHNDQTWISLLDKKFPNAPMADDGAPEGCPTKFFGGVAKNKECDAGVYRGGCVKCWNREAIE